MLLDTASLRLSASAIALEKMDRWLNLVPTSKVAAGIVGSPLVTVS